MHGSQRIRRETVNTRRRYVVWVISDGNTVADAKYLIITTPKVEEDASFEWVKDPAQALHFGRQSDATAFCERFAPTDTVVVDRSWDDLPSMI